jgi:hypothetical protein
LGLAVAESNVVDGQGDTSFEFAKVAAARPLFRGDDDKAGTPLAGLRIALFCRVIRKPTNEVPHEGEASRNRMRALKPLLLKAQMGRGR